MGITEGAQTTVYFGGGDATGILNELNDEGGYNTVRADVFGVKAERYMGLQRNGKIKLSGFYDPDGNLPPDVMLAAQALGSTNKGVVLYSWFDGDGIPGDRGEGGYILAAGAVTPKTATDINKIEVNGVPAGVQDRLQLLFKMQPVTGNGSSAPLLLTTDLDTADTVAHLYVQAATVSATVKIYHKDIGDASWAELFSFNVSTGRSATRSITLTAIKDEVYLGWTLSGPGSLTLAAAIGAGTTSTVGFMPGMWTIPGILMNNQSYIP